MRNGILKIATFFLILFFTYSCYKDSREETVYVGRIRIKIFGSINELQDELAGRETLLVYENSYDGESKGIKLYYFDDKFDRLNYHSEVYILRNKISGLNVDLYSNEFSPEELRQMIFEEILPRFRNAVNNEEISIDFKVDSLQDIEQKSHVNYSFKAYSKELKRLRP